jgi:hypothetical protein
MPFNKYPWPRAVPHCARLCNGFKVRASDFKPFITCFVKQNKRELTIIKMSTDNTKYHQGIVARELFMNMKRVGRAVLLWTSLPTVCFPLRKNKNVSLFSSAFRIQWWRTLKHGNNLNVVFLNWLSGGHVILAYLGSLVQNSKAFLYLEFGVQLVNQTEQGLIWALNLTH